MNNHQLIGFVPQTKLALDGWWGALLPDALHEMAAAFQISTGASSEIVVATILSALGALASHCCEVESTCGHNTPLNTFFLVAAESGQGKSSCLSAILGPFFELEDELRAQSERLKDARLAECEVWKIQLNSLKRRISKSSADGDDLGELQSMLNMHFQSKPLERPSLGCILTNPTMAGLLEHLSSAILGTFLANADSGKLFEDIVLKNTPSFCSIWSGEPIISKKKHQNIFIDRPDMTMLLMLQPMYLAGLFSEKSDFRRSGLAARTLLVKARQQTYVTHRNDNEYAVSLRKKWNDAVTNWLKSIKFKDGQGVKEAKRVIRISGEARDYISALHESAKSANSLGRELPFMRDYALRKHEHILRISALYCFVRNEEVLIIGKDDVQRAENFIKIAFDFACEEIYQYSEEAKVVKNANRVMHFIAGRIVENRYFYNGTQVVLLMSDLMQYGPVRKKDELDKVISHLILERKILVGPFSYQENGKTVTRKAVFVFNIFPSIVGGGLYNSSSHAPLLI